MSPRTRLMPHQTIGPDRCEWGAWQLTDATVAELDGKRLKSWDYAQATGFQRTLRVDVEGALGDLEVAGPEALEVVGLLDCSHTGRRIVSRTALPKDGVVIVRVSAEPGELAMTVDLSSHVVMGPVSGTGAGAAGARLAWAESQRFVLEGTGARFPVQPFSFRRSNRRPAAWSVDVVWEELTDSFVGGFNLVVNTDHPAGKAALDPTHEDHAKIASIIRYEIVRNIVDHVAPLSGVPGLLGEPYEEGSVGAVFKSICNDMLNVPPETVLDAWDGDTVGFHEMLQARLGLLMQVKA